MIGRQMLLNLDAEKLQKNLKQFGLETEAPEKILTDADGYAEPFLRILGACEIASFDASDYEKATCVHDFNRPIPDGFKDKFSVVLDGGTLEHIFNFPTAIKNCMEMVREGGHYLSITPTNNFLGHGFYQFSPELFFRVLSPANGFETEQIFIHEEFPESEWYAVTDPQTVRERVILINRYPSYLFIIAKKIHTVEIFKTAPQQSDYSAMWQESEETTPEAAKTPPGGATNGREIIRLLKRPLSPLASARRRLLNSFAMLNRRPKHFKKSDLT